MAVVKIDLNLLLLNLDGYKFVYLINYSVNNYDFISVKQPVIALWRRVAELISPSPSRGLK